ncbi:MAG: GAF domain-containing protein [Erysipelotrichaceae bacterium]|nr:MAG: GAF domain-containing [Erysipelotrichaceae bacterium]TXT16625.1 MAG: GAF domain-containing protein [Erysipelotrichaceae bacterium]
MNTLIPTQDLDLLLKQAEALLEGEKDKIANMANLSALVYHSIPDLNWVGFYIYKDRELVLGPFQGLPACVRLQLNKGVCGTSASLRMTLNVPDVHAFEGHVACDSASNSECVVPIYFIDELYGVFDVDSPIVNRFDKELQKFLEDIGSLFIKTYE